MVVLGYLYLICSFFDGDGFENNISEIMILGVILFPFLDMGRNLWINICI